MSVGNKNRFCDIIEYRMGARERLMENELSVSGLYIVMFELGETGRAARYPVLIDSVNKNESEQTNVQFRTYDDDLRVLTMPLGSAMQQGFLASQGIHVPPHFVATEGYFKGYADATDIELEMMNLLSAELTESPL